MENIENITLVLSIVLILFFVMQGTLEQYGGSGALVQLYSRGIQDTYQTNDAYKYIAYPSPYFYDYPLLPFMFWNMPTHVKNPYVNLYDPRGWWNIYY